MNETVVLAVLPHCGSHFILPVMRSLLGQKPTVSCHVHGYVVEGVSFDYPIAPMLVGGRFIRTLRGPKVFSGFPFKAVAIFRDPRDALVSQWRHWSNPIRAEHKKHRFDLHATIDNFFFRVIKRTGETESHTWNRFTEWRKHPGVLAVDYDEMIRSKYEIDRIANFLGVCCDADHVYSSVYGKSNFFNLKPSRHEDFFEKKHNKLFNRHGQNLLERMPFLERSDVVQ